MAGLKAWQRPIASEPLKARGPCRKADALLIFAPYLTSSGWLIAIGLAVLIGLVIAFPILRNSLVYISNTEYGIVERKWARRRSRVGDLSFGLVALNSEAGFVPGVLRGGWHYLAPFQYRVHKKPLIRIDQIAYLVTRVGSPLREGQALGEWPAGVDIEDARAFLEKGGQRGSQRQIVRSGTYAINTALHCVITEDAIYNVEDAGSPDDTALQELLRERRGFDPIVISDDNVGIVTVQDGLSLTHGEIIAPTVGADIDEAATFHNSFQDVAKFFRSGGRRGRQEQVLVEGTYYLNRLFATVEIKPKLKVGIGTVAVVNSYVGRDIKDSIEADGGRGRTVDVGQRGIWKLPLEPGKYPINPYAMEVTVVPTTNFQLRWMEDVTSRLNDARSEANRVAYDEELREIPVITKDAFEILLPISIVAHISPGNAPHVIQRFSQVSRLVNQTIDPLVSSFFRDTAQDKTAIEFFQARSEIGEAAKAEMKRRLAEHRIDIEEVMIGTPQAPRGSVAIEQLFDQLRQRQIAKEQEATYKAQVTAATELRSLNEAKAIALQQDALTQSKISIEIARNEGDADTARKKQQAEGIKVLADAEAHASKVKAEAIGGAENLVKQYVVDKITNAITASKLPLVPQTYVGGGGADATSGAGGIVQALMALTLDRSLREPSDGSKTG